MAHFDTILEDLKRVADEIGMFVARRTEQRRDDSGLDTERDSEPYPLEVTETITVWQLTLEAQEVLNQSGSIRGDVVHWVEQQPFLHHQIRLRGKTAACARSYRHKISERQKQTPEKPHSSVTEHSEKQKVLSQISYDASYASLLTREFARIDQNDFEDDFIEADPVVRLLEIPSFQVYVLWLFANDESRIIVLSAARRYKNLAPGALLKSEDFFEALRIGGPLRDVI